MLENLEAIVAIVVIDLVLSGDNAVVIGMAARHLSPENRRRAIVLGGAGAVALRVTFTALAASLLGIPYLRSIGGVLLLWIAWKLVRPGAGHDGSINGAESLGEAIRTIVLADAVMSLDNILAVGGAAEGDLSLLLFGLLVSIPILLLGSDLVARVLGRAPALVYAGVLVLVHTAIGMVFEDGAVHDRLPEAVRDVVAADRIVWLAAIAATGVLALVALAQERRTASREAPGPSPDGRQAHGMADPTPVAARAPEQHADEPAARRR